MSHRIESDLDAGIQDDFDASDLQGIAACVQQSRRLSTASVSTTPGPLLAKGNVVGLHPAAAFVDITAGGIGRWGGISCVPRKPKVWSIAWRRDARERKRVLAYHDLGLAKDRVSERRVDAKGPTVDLASEAPPPLESQPPHIVT